MESGHGLHLSTIEGNGKPENGSKNGSRAVTLTIISLLLSIILFIISQYRSFGLPWNIIYSIESYKETIRYIALAVNCVAPIVGLFGIGFGVIAIIKRENKISKPIIALFVNAILVLITSCPLVLYLVYFLMPNPY